MNLCLLYFCRHLKCSIILCACVSVSVWMYGAYLGGCTGRHRLAWRCRDVNWSDHADRGRHTRFRGRSGNEVAGPPLPPVPLSRSPSAACLGSQHPSSPATRLSPWGRNRQVRHKLTQRHSWHLATWLLAAGKLATLLKMYTRHTYKL